MTPDWDVLRDRPCPAVAPSVHRTCSASSLRPWAGTDAELLAIFASVVARYTGRGDVAVGWSGGDGWRRVALVVDVDRPMGDVVLQAAGALAGSDPGPVPAFGIACRLPATVDGPSLLAVGADGTVRYADSCYTEADATRFAQHLTTFAAAAGTGVPVGRMPLMSERELTDLHAADASAGHGTDLVTVPDLIEAQVRARPAAVAVRGAGGDLSYSSLWGRSGPVARRLKPGTKVGVWAERTTDMVVALVAVLRAGCAYVALEPSYPLARLRELVSIAGLSAVVASGEVPDLGVDVMVVGDEEGDGPTTEPRPSDLAYVMFTSGSTGTPKGVMVEHRNVVNTLLHMGEDPGLGPGETALGVTTAAFDLSVPDLFLPLTTGATLVVASADDARDASRLAALIEAVQPHFMQATPATWRMLCESGWPGAHRLRAVCGGEAYDSALVRALMPRVAGVWNFYGPTETTVWSVSTRLSADVEDPIPLGVSMRGTACYVLDERGEPVPPGVRGELHIAGAGVARGYLGRPDLTERVFVPCPVERAPSPIMYRTGDLVRADSDGTLRFAGRRDFQVKLNGFRIELGEVETVIGRLPGVRQAVATLRGDDASQRLVCYVTGVGLDATQLRRAASLLLPPQAVPNVFIILAALPLTANDKVDRASLPMPGSGIGQPPSGVIEVLVAGVFAEVLQLPAVYADDDLFALGAGSLDVGRVAIRLTAELSVDVAPGLIFRNPVIRDLALALLEQLLGSDPDVLAEVQRS